MKSFLAFIIFFGSQAFAAAPAEPSEFEKSMAAIEAFVNSPKVTPILDQYKVAGDASAIPVEKAPDACSIIETYFVAQPVESQDSPGWITIKGTVELQYNICEKQPIEVRSVELVDLKAK